MGSALFSLSHCLSHCAIYLHKNISGNLNSGVRDRPESIARSEIASHEKARGVSYNLIFYSLARAQDWLKRLLNAILFKLPCTHLISRLLPNRACYCAISAVFLLILHAYTPIQLCNNSILQAMTENLFVDADHNCAGKSLWF